MSKRGRQTVHTPLAKKIKMVNGTSTGGGQANVEIDEDLHSRQLAVYGRESMRKMASTSVLIIGAGALGVEVAKNVVLAGVKAVTVFDSSVVTLQDLSAQFYLTLGDVGKNRAEACKDRLQELNSAVTVFATSGELSNELIEQFQVVVMTEGDLAEAQRVDAFCHTHSPTIAFIKAEIRGVFANLFCDFGPAFHVLDVDGEEPFTGIIASISSGNPALVTCVDDERLEFQDGMTVTFSEVEGMTELNNYAPIRIRNVKRESFELMVDTSEFSPYVKGGIVTQHKEPKLLNFKTLEECLKEPGEFLLSDFSKLDRSGLLHAAFQALDAFRKETGRFPTPGNSADADRVVALAKEVQCGEGKMEVDQDEDLLRKFASGSSAELNPMAATFGGIVGQEVVKAASGKFHPTFQWFYFDCAEALPKEHLPADEVQPIGSRYDHQIAVFGKTLQKKLGELNLFLVGAGALGCEFLKNFAMMGVACGESGCCTVTDDDQIEKSNLSRQFLFRDWNIGEPKSTVAADAAVALNGEFKVKPLQNRVSPDTEDVFNDKFWKGLDLVVNALDNVNARLYVDSRCVYFCKPLLESGTLGPKCNTQMVIPHLTENYGASRDPPEKEAPMCTVHSFPHNIAHCLAWARSEFEGLFEKGPTEANAYLDAPEKYTAKVLKDRDAAARQRLEEVVQVLTKDACKTFEECINAARVRFEDYFHNKIGQLIFTFPEDAVTSSGTPFWSAPKRFPKVLDFTASDSGHASLVQALAILTAEIYGIEKPEWASDKFKVAEAAAAIDVPRFVPKEGVYIETDPNADKNQSSMHMTDEDALIKDLCKQLSSASKDLPTGFRLNPIEFEKDDDTNYHMDAIAGFANMRARNYSITEVDKLKAKFIAGRIIPAIATTTAMATGLVCLELYKAVQEKPVEDYRNTFANLAVPLFAMAEPVPPKVYKFQDLSWSLWDRWVLEGDYTVQEVLDHFRKKNMDVYSISAGASLLYNTIFPKHKERINKKLSDLIQTVGKQEIPPWKNYFDVIVACEDDSGEDLDVPCVTIVFRPEQEDVAMAT